MSPQHLSNLPFSTLPCADGGHCFCRATTEIGVMLCCRCNASSKPAPTPAGLSDRVERLDRRPDGQSALRDRDRAAFASGAPTPQPEKITKLADDIDTHRKNESKMFRLTGYQDDALFLFAQRVRELGAPTPATGQTCWLVELAEPTRWYTGRDDPSLFSTDPDDALRFARRADAQVVIDNLLPPSYGARAVEHLWIR